MICAFVVGFAMHRGRLKYRNIHARSLDRDLTTIDRLAKEVVGADRASHVIAGPVTAFGLGVLAGEINRNLELWQDILFHVEGDLGGIGGCAIGFTRGCSCHQRSQVVRAQVHLIGKAKLG